MQGFHDWFPHTLSNLFIIKFSFSPSPLRWHPAHLFGKQIYLQEVEEVPYTLPLFQIYQKRDKKYELENTIKYTITVLAIVYHQPGTSLWAYPSFLDNLSL